ncbi:abi-like family protein, partial [Neisseria gonorrhoeae]
MKRQFKNKESRVSVNYKECCSIFSDFRMERYKNAVRED